MNPATDRERWERTARELPRWNARNRLIADLIPPGSAVVDLGSGARTLGEMLPEGCRYTPVDLVASPGGIVCDFNAGEFPDLPEPVDIAVCSGVLEYLTDLPGFLRRLPVLAPRAIVSYAVWRPYQTRAGRRRAGWVSDLVRAELESALAGAGLRHHDLAVWGGQDLLEVWTGDGGNGPVLARAPADPPPDDWADGLRALHEFVTGHGHAAGPRRADAGSFDLHGWIRRMRGTWRAGRLDPALVAELEAFPGWCWGSDELDWEERFAQRRAAAGADSVPDDLVRWGHFQRALGVEGRLHPERERRLREIGAI